MYKKRDTPIDSIDLTGMSDDEIHYKGEQFVEELKAILNKYLPYFNAQPLYQNLLRIHKNLQSKLEEEERKVE